jgi:aminoglycoside phosphotransferase (APT) family kinase protein
MCGIGDPACDLLAAWGIFSAPEREVFLRELNPDEPTFLRARGLALSVAFLIFSYYQTSNRALAKLAQKMIAEIFAEF